jgi:hypothetical protein
MVSSCTSIFPASAFLYLVLSTFILSISLSLSILPSPTHPPTHSLTALLHLAHVARGRLRVGRDEHVGARALRRQRGRGAPGADGPGRMVRFLAALCV